MESKILSVKCSRYASSGNIATTYTIGKNTVESIKIDTVTGSIFVEYKDTIVEYRGRSIINIVRSKDRS